MSLKKLARRKQSRICPVDGNTNITAPNPNHADADFVDGFVDFVVADDAVAVADRTSFVDDVAAVVDESERSRYSKPGFALRPW